MQFDLNARPDQVIRVVEQGVAQAIDRYNEHLGKSEKREELRRQLEERLQQIVSVACADLQSIFGEVQLVPDEWLGTGEWMAFIRPLASVTGGDPTESYYAHQAFTNHTAQLPNLHERNGSVAFTMNALTAKIEQAVREAARGAAEMIRRVRVVRAEQMTTHTRFAAALKARYGPRPDL